MCIVSVVEFSLATVFGFVLYVNFGHCLGRGLCHSLGVGFGIGLVGDLLLL